MAIIHKVLVLGAGMVAKPLIDYLLKMGTVKVTQVDVDIAKAVAMIGDHPNGVAGFLDLETPEGLEKMDKLVSENDLAVSLLPAVFHVRVAKACLKHGKNMCTSSYISPEMRELDAEAKKKGLIFMNEMGVDPGIDHMSAKKVIDEIQARGGVIESFKSTTGALPSAECTANPMGYKFSWAPRGVLLASRNAAHWIQDGVEMNVPGEDLFKHYSIEDVPGLGTFEAYPNRDSVPYREIYGLTGVKTIFRGTFRYIGWCETLYFVRKLGWLDLDEIKDVKTYADVTRKLIGSPSGDLKDAVAKHLGIPVFSAIMKRLEWLSLFSDMKIPSGVNCPLDFLNVITVDKMTLPAEEKDMIVMHHEFKSVYPDGKKEKVTSTLIDYGVPGEYTSVAKTVALAAAIGARMILEGIITEPGVRIPVTTDVYNPCLEELEKYGIKFIEHTSTY